MPTEAVVAIPLGCLSLLIVVTNSCVCLLVYLHAKLRSYTNGFVVSLAVSDILTGALLLPLYISVPEFNGTGYIVSAILLTGVANVCAVTLDRYLAIAKPFIYYAVMTRHFVKFIVGSWVLPMVISIIPLIWSSDAGLAHTIYLFLIQGLGVVVPYIFVCTAYYLIFHEARHIVRRLRRESSLSWRNHEDKNKGRKNSNTMASEAKVAKMFALIAISFILSWLPVLYLTSVISAVDKRELVDKLSPAWLLDFSLFTVALGSMVNPVVYSFFKPDFRRIIKRMLGKRPQWSSLKHSENCVIDVPLILKRLESGKEGKETDLWILLTLRSEYIGLKFSEITSKCRHKSIYYSLVSLYTNLFQSVLYLHCQRIRDRARQTAVLAKGVNLKWTYIPFSICRLVLVAKIACFDEESLTFSAVRRCFSRNYVASISLRMLLVVPTPCFVAWAHSNSPFICCENKRMLF